MEEPKRRARRAQAQLSIEELMQQQLAQEQLSKQLPPQAAPEQNGFQDEPQGSSAQPEEQTVPRRRSGKEKAVRSVKETLLLIVLLLDGARRAAVKALSAICLPDNLREKWKKIPLREALMALLVGVMLFSGWQVGSIVLRSARTTKLNEELSAQRAGLIEAMEEAEAMQEPEATAHTWNTPDAQVLAALATPMPAVQNMPAVQPAEKEDAQAEAPAPTRAPDVVTSTKYHQMGGDALSHMAALRSQNTDLTAWLQIPDVLDLPVVYRDNSYYLNRDFHKQKNASGTIFLDENHPFREKTQNLLLHGHNMKDGTMFGRLAQYLSDDTYLRNHPFIYFDTLWKKEQYVIFAVLDVSLDPKSERFFNYFTHSTFRSDAEFASYIRQLQLRSSYAIPVDVEAGDALLTLSTCLDDDRLVIVARRLRENETRSQLRELIRMAVRQ